MENINVNSKPWGGLSPSQFQYETAKGTYVSSSNNKHPDHFI